MDISFDRRYRRNFGRGLFDLGTGARLARR